MIETYDLPEPVRRAIREGVAPAMLRHEAAQRAFQVDVLSRVGEWEYVRTFLDLAAGYLTAADRIEAA